MRNNEYIECVRPYTLRQITLTYGVKEIQYEPDKIIMLISMLQENLRYSTTYNKFFYIIIYAEDAVARG